MSLPGFSFLFHGNKFNNKELFIKKLKKLRLCFFSLKTFLFKSFY